MEEINEPSSFSKVINWIKDSLDLRIDIFVANPGIANFRPPSNWKLESNSIKKRWS
jgi:hypothetical protein